MKIHHINAHERAQAVKILVLDVDGVLTDGALYYTAQGEEQKVFHVQDGLGLEWMQSAGIPVAIISGRSSLAAEKRFKELQIRYIYQGQKNKLAILNQLLKQLDLDLSEVAYVGDDLPDLPLIRRVGLSFAVANAVSEIKQYSSCETGRPGGQGAIREVCEFILDAKDLLKEIYQQYS